MGNWRSTVWNDQAARDYSDALDLSDYVQRITPYVAAGKACHGYQSLLDIGAGDGRFAEALTCPGARIDAIEPSSAMRSMLKKRLKDRELRVWDVSWTDCPDNGAYDLGFAANIGAFKTAPVQLFTKMRKLCQSLAWVVPAQQGPSSFCLSGLVAHWLPQEHCEPVYLSVLDALGAAHAPSSVDVEGWTYRQCFADAGVAVDFLMEKLTASGTTIPRTQIKEFVEEGGTFDDRGRVTLEAPKRSAILRWI